MSTIAGPRFARVAAAIGDPTRALMLSRLLDGRYYTATDLAAHAGIAASTASQHLKLLVDERLARVRAQGRHRYFMLADANVAHALEALLRVADVRVADVRVADVRVADSSLPESTRWQAPAMRGLRHARSCYGHLAGQLGVGLCRSFIRRGWVSTTQQDGHDYPLTASGVAQLRQIGIAVDAGSDADGRRKPQLYGCVDWSERRDHFAGPVAVALLDTFIERGWVARCADSRELIVTAAGKTGAFASLVGDD
jgi:DNA-binding transcriptional ArsR family regulator